MEIKRKRYLKINSKEKTSDHNSYSFLGVGRLESSFHFFSPNILIQSSNKLETFKDSSKGFLETKHLS